VPPRIEVSGLLGDHDRRSVGVAAHDDGHDRGVDDAQLLYAAHPQCGIDHGTFADAHGAGSHRVEAGSGGIADHQVGVLAGVRVDAGDAEIPDRLDLGPAAGGL